MTTESLLSYEDRLFVELVAKKMGVALIDLLSVSFNVCQFGVPSPSDFFPSRREVFHAFALMARCVHSPLPDVQSLTSQIGHFSFQFTELSDNIIDRISILVNWKQMDSSAHYLVVHQIEEIVVLFLDSINRYLQLVGSSQLLDENIAATCLTILETFPKSFRSTIRERLV